MSVIFRQPENDGSNNETDITFSKVGAAGDDQHDMNESIISLHDGALTELARYDYLNSWGGSDIEKYKAIRRATKMDRKKGFLDEATLTRREG